MTLPAGSAVAKGEPRRGGEKGGGRSAAAPPRYWNSFNELMTVCSTPRTSGMPTKPQARRRCKLVVPCGFSFAMVLLSYASAATMVAPTERLSPSFMWNRRSTAFTKRLQMKPITRSPAMMYIVVL
jgi:hypothetical protein